MIYLCMQMCLCTHIHGIRYTIIVTWVVKLTQLCGPDERCRAGLWVGPDPQACPMCQIQCAEPVWYRCCRQHAPGLAHMLLAACVPAPDLCTTWCLWCLGPGRVMFYTWHAGPVCGAAACGTYSRLAPYARFRTLHQSVGQIWIGFR